MKDQLTFEDDDRTVVLQRSWASAIRRLQPEIPSAWFERFIRPLKPIRYEMSTFEIGVPGKFVQEWVRERYLSTIQSFLSDEVGEPITVELILEAREKTQHKIETPSAAVSVVATDVQSFKPSPKFSFETFVTGQSNRYAVAGAKAVAANPGGKYNPLFIYGPSGLGKTHLLHSIARELLSQSSRFPLVYITAQQFAEEFVTALQNNKIEQFRRAQRSVGIWLVDDIQLIAGRDKTQEEIFHTFNYLHSLGKQIVLTSDRPPRDLYLMDERLRSRFESGLVADIQMPDTETRCAILLSKASQEGIELDMSVAMFLAESVPGNIRVLEGALTKLAAVASVDSATMSMDLALRIVDQHYRAGVLAKPSVETIMEAVGTHFRISTDEMKGPSRKAPIVQARHVAVFLSREIRGDSWKHIGGIFGDRDHTSMMHGYQKISELMHYDRELRGTIKMLMRNLYPEG